MDHIGVKLYAVGLAIPMVIVNESTFGFKRKESLKSHMILCRRCSQCRTNIPIHFTVIFLLVVASAGIDYPDTGHLRVAKC